MFKDVVLLNRFDNNYDEDYTLSVERKVDEIRAEALKIVQKINPKIQYVVDRRSINDYSERIWDYPGKWYLYFKLPDGFRRKEELIHAIVEETLQYFSKNGNENVISNNKCK